MSALAAAFAIFFAFLMGMIIMAAIIFVPSLLDWLFQDR